MEYFTYISGWVFANCPGDLGSILGGVIPKTLKVVLDTSCLKLSNIRYISRVKWSNPGKGVVASPTPRCSSYWKGSLLETLANGRQLTYVYISSSSSCRAGITDIPDPLSPLLPIVHRPRQVFRTTSRILT